MKMAAAAVENGGAITMGGEQRLDVGALQKLELRVAVQCFRFVLFGEQLLALTRFDRDVHCAPMQIAVDCMTRDALTQFVERLDGDVPKLTSVVAPQRGDELRLAACVACERLTAASSRSAPAN